MSIQWLLRERLWKRGTSDATERSVAAGDQIATIICLLDLENQLGVGGCVSATKVLNCMAECSVVVGVQNDISKALMMPTGGITVLGRVALLRAAVSVFDIAALMWPNDFECSLEKHLIAGKYECCVGAATEKIEDENDVVPGLLLGSIFHLIISVVEDVNPQLQVYGLQTLETWLGRIDIEGIGKYDSSNTSGLLSIEQKMLRSLLLNRLYRVSHVLCRSWSHPHKLINHVVPSVFQRLIDLLSNIERSMTSKDAIYTPDYDDVWCTVLAQALKLPPEHRGRYQALSVLLPKIGARRFLHVQPDIFRILVVSIRIRDVSSAVSHFIGCFLSSIKDYENMDLQSLRSLYSQDVVEILCSTEQRLRLNGNDYLLQELMKFDPDGCGPSLINGIRNLSSQHSAEHRLWGVISVALQARLLSRRGGEIDFGTASAGVHFPLKATSNSKRSWQDSTTSKSQPEDIEYLPLQSHEVEEACFSQDVDLRLAGLTVLVASQKTVAPMHPLEMELLKNALPHSLKSHVPDHRQRVLRILRLLLTRYN